MDMWGANEVVAGGMCGNGEAAAVMSWLVCVQVRASSVHMQEGGVQLELTLVDTPGFGDVVDNSNW